MGSWQGCNVPVSARLERSEAIQEQFQIGEANVRWVPAFKTAAINHLSVRPDSLHAGSGLENHRGSRSLR